MYCTEDEENTKSVTYFTTGNSGTLTTKLQKQEKSKNLIMYWQEISVFYKWLFECKQCPDLFVYIFWMKCLFKDKMKFHREIKLLFLLQYNNHTTAGKCLSKQYLINVPYTNKIKANGGERKRGRAEKIKT